MPELTIRYSYTRAEWLRGEWPAVVFWALPALVWVGFAGVFLWSRSICGVLFLVPAWFFCVAKFANILRFLLRGSQAVILRIPAGGHPWISSDDGAHWTPVTDPMIYDQRGIWCLVGQGGGVHLPIPKHAITEEEREALFARVPPRIFPTTPIS